jgi:hypothetical protein
MTMAAYNAARALVNDQNFSSKNVRVEDGKFYLHETLIAEKPGAYHLYLYPNKYPSATTNRYLNGLIQYVRPLGPRLHIQDKKAIYDHHRAPSILVLDFWLDWCEAIGLYSPTGNLVHAGESLVDSKGTVWTVEDIVKPHKPGSTGRVHVRHPGTGQIREFFPSVLNLHWKPAKEL